MCLGTLQGLRSPSCSSVTFTLQVSCFFIFFLDGEHCVSLIIFIHQKLLFVLYTAFSGISFSSARNYYDVLGVSPKATREDIKKSFHEVSHCYMKCVFNISCFLYAPREKLEVDCPLSSLCIECTTVQLAKKFHPDTNRNNPSAKKKFQEIREAYEVLYLFFPVNLTQCVF